MGKFYDRIMPEPLHLEINSWQYMLDVLCKEAVRRGQFKQFINTLRSPPNFEISIRCKGMWTILYYKGNYEAL